MADGEVIAVSRSGGYLFTKPNQAEIRLVEGYGVEGDVHAGKLVKHRSRVARTPNVENLRQVHLMHDELHEELRAEGFDVAAGQLGENLTTHGIDVLNLPTGALLTLGDEAVVEVTGLRNPCVQIENFRAGLLKRLLQTDDDGNVVRLAGIMSVVRHGGTVRPGDSVSVELPKLPHRRLDAV
jgi:MOSC domain-containing protein YiiM